ncbi:MAG: pyruvate, phosphate dikinase [Calditrichaeota bacterium]|nr:MAG: pyruvate, phosphate dikinase [Calditrichota bacterium]
MSKKYVYFFGAGKAEGRADMKDLLGGKGANLAEMTNLGIPVPAGFTISTEVCTYYYQHNGQYPEGLAEQVDTALKNVEKVMNSRFGDPENPLLVSVRSGARVSMPGMMDTVLNLGLNDQTVQGLIKKTSNPRFGYDCYRRFVAMYGDVVLGMKPESEDDIDPFEAILEAKKKARGVQLDTELTADDLKELVAEYKQLILERTGQPFPEDPRDQLWGAIGAVFRSWNNERAIVYRQIHNIPDEWGTAVNVQSMVYGNMGEDSGTGVAFTRNPATGEKELYGEFLINAQGEDVVAGIRTPITISKLGELMPDVYRELQTIADKLERHYRDMQDMEFTIQQGRLWMLQTRVGKRTGLAAFRIAVDMVEEGLIDEKEALLRVEPDQLNQLLRPVFDAGEKEQAVRSGRLLTRGLNAGPGAATGRVVFNASDAVAWKEKGERVILVRIETSPEDIKGMHAAEGILTARGGMTSHAALVGRQMGKVCVVGAGEIEIDYKARQFRVGNHTIKEGDWISLDGTTGEVIEGKLQTRPSEVIQVLIEKSLKPEASKIFHVYQKMMSWADQYRRLGVRTNADQPDQARVAIAFGAEGIGLCRTEHMFFGGNRILAMREMILADTVEERKAALDKLLPMQRQDFIEIFRVMRDRPVTIRTLDPPLHEFLPHTDQEIQELAEQLGISEHKIRARLEALREFNPMLGHRGCRLGITFPEITEMQARAILEAACEVKKEGLDVKPEIMIPLVSEVRELEAQEEVVRRVAKEVFERYGFQVNYLVGTMIEIPRAAVTAARIAQAAEFFSFGTNDLTQTTFGMSRDDAGKFLPFYLEHKILPYDPFARIDFEGVGKLMEWGIQQGRQTRPKLKVGICGEHGGEPASVEFCHQLGMNYVSCSPFRVPIARLAAAQAVLKASA